MAQRNSAHIPELVFEPNISGWSLLNSWEDEDRNRYFPLRPWTDPKDKVEILVRDGGTGRATQMLFLSLEETIAYGNKRIGTAVDFPAMSNGRE